MPRKTGKAKTRRTGRRRRYTRNRGLQNLSLQVMPKIRFATHRYAENSQLFINNVFSDQIKLSLNGMYDPNISGGSGQGINHQPYLFDQLNALYNTYTVLGAKVTVILRPGSTSNTYATNVYGEISELSSIQYPGSIAWEKPGIKKALFNSSSANVYNPMKVMQFKWSALKQFRCKDRQELISNEQYNGNSSSNPAHECFLYLTMQAQQLQQTTVKLACDIIIDYICAWTEPKQPNQS